MQYKGLSLKKAFQFLVQQEPEEVKGDRGVIAIDPKSNIAMEFDSRRMHRGLKVGEELYFANYPGE